MSKDIRFSKFLGAIIAGALIVGGCAGQTSKMSDAEKAEQAVAKAEEMVQEVRQETGDWGLWKSTMGILGNAKKSLEKGDYQAATEAANEVQYETEKGLAQWREERDQWQLAAQAAKSAGDFPESQWTAGG
ncbi:hypothetical protein [Thiohalorhabdus sp.]|uniref:hypothetical protein n=1 Tax=Thiohalorhabdus sp. TaxID=3094134 RepID=UPI002FC277B3